MVETYDMYLKYYKIYERLGLLGFGGIPLIAPTLLKLLLKTHIIKLYQAEYQIFTVVSLVISGFVFVISMGYYYKILDVFTQVTTVTKKQKWILIFTHIISLVALILFALKFTFELDTFVPHFLFMSSIIIRQCCKLRDITSNMKQICEELDVELRKIGYAALSEEEKDSFMVGIK